MNNYLRTYDPGYTPRHYDENYFYFITKHKQDYFRNSFFVRSANLCNSLSLQLKSCTSISVFSSRLRKCIKKWKFLMMTEFLSKARILKCLFSELRFYVFGRCIVIQFGVNWGASPVPLSSLTNSMLCYCMFCTSLNNQSCLYVNEL